MFSYAVSCPSLCHCLYSTCILSLIFDHSKATLADPGSLQQVQDFGAAAAAAVARVMVSKYATLLLDPGCLGGKKAAAWLLCWFLSFPAG